MTALSRDKLACSRALGRSQIGMSGYVSCQGEQILWINALKGRVHFCFWWIGVCKNTNPLSLCGKKKLFKMWVFSERVWNPVVRMEEQMVRQQMMTLQEVSLKQKAYSDVLTSLSLDHLFFPSCTLWVWPCSTVSLCSVSLKSTHQRQISHKHFTFSRLSVKKK